MITQRVNGMICLILSLIQHGDLGWTCSPAGSERCGVSGLAPPIGGGPASGTFR
jgi:hypothetical protein